MSEPIKPAEIDAIGDIESIMDQAEKTGAPVHFSHQGQELVLMRIEDYQHALEAKQAREAALSSASDPDPSDPQKD